MQQELDFRIHHSHTRKLQFNQLAKRFAIKAFLPDHMLATANENSLPGLDEVLFVWPLPFDLPGIGDPVKRFYPLPA